MSVLVFVRDIQSFLFLVDVCVRIKPKLGRVFEVVYLLKALSVAVFASARCVLPDIPPVVTKLFIIKTVSPILKRV